MYYFLLKIGIFQPAMLVYQRVLNWCRKELRAIRSLGKNKSRPKPPLDDVLGSQTLPKMLKKFKFRNIIIGQFCQDSTRVTKIVVNMYIFCKKEVGNHQGRLQQGKKVDSAQFQLVYIVPGSKLRFFPYNRG